MSRKTAFKHGQKSPKCGKSAEVAQATLNTMIENLQVEVTL